MSQSDLDAPVPSWVHAIPAWVTAFIMVVGGLIAGGAVYGQVTKYEPRIGHIEQSTADQGTRITTLEAHAADSTARLDRIEHKVDQLISFQGDHGGR